MLNRLVIYSIVCGLALTNGANASEKRCGWFDNPSPANAWLIDKDGEWIIAVQMGYQAEGKWPPKFLEGEKIDSGNASYGYGCACFEVETDSTKKRIVKIISTETKTLATCREDKSLIYKKNLYDGIKHELKDSNHNLK